MGKVEKISFKNNQGEMLSAHMGKPDDAYALLAHCFACNKKSKGSRAYYQRVISTRDCYVLRNRL